MKFNRTALLAAVRSNDPETVRRALPPRLNAMSGDDAFEAVRTAAEEGHAAALATLLEFGIPAGICSDRVYNPEISVDTGSEPLIHFAAAGGEIECVRLFMDRGVKLDVQDGMGQTALHRAAMRGRAQMVRFLIDAGAAVEAVSFDGTPLRAAVRQGHRECAQILLDAGADPKNPGGTQGSPMDAARREHPELLGLLEEFAHRRG